MEYFLKIVETITDQTADRIEHVRFDKTLTESRNCVVESLNQSTTASQHLNDFDTLGFYSKPNKTVVSSTVFLQQ